MRGSYTNKRMAMSIIFYASSGQEKFIMPTTA